MRLFKDIFDLEAAPGHPWFKLSCHICLHLPEIAFMLSHTSLALIIAAIEFGRSCPLECIRPHAC